MSRKTLIALLALVVCLAALAWAAGGGALWRMVGPARPAPPRMVESNVGDTALVYDPAYARFPAGRSGGRLDRLEVAILAPEFKPAGEIARADPMLVFLTLAPQDRAVDPAERVTTLYANFLEADVAEDESGLIKRRFAAGSPFEGEDLYFDAPEGRSFAARCARPTAPPDLLPQTCLAAFRLEGLDVEARFDREALKVWPQLADGVRALARSFVAR